MSGLGAPTPRAARGCPLAGARFGVDALACRAVSSASGPALGGDGRTSAALDLPDELRADVRLLGEILGEVLVEYGGQGLTSA